MHGNCLRDPVGLLSRDDGLEEDGHGPQGLEPVLGGRWRDDCGRRSGNPPR